VSATELVEPAPSASPGTHLVLAGVRQVHELLDQLLGPAEVGLGALGDEQLETAVTEWTRVITRVEALQLKLVSSADSAQVAAAEGMTGTDAWLASRTRSDRAKAAGTLRLAGALSRGCAVTGAALDAGELSSEHAQVIVRATEQLPADLDDADRGAVELSLVEQARQLDPGALRKAARRALAAVEDDRAAVDAHEDAVLTQEEDAAFDRTRLTLHDNADGTVSGHFTVPSYAGSILHKVIDQMTSPRRGRLGASDAQAGSTGRRLDRAQVAGQAFTELLEHLPTDRLHGKVAATVVVTIDHPKLKDALGAAGVDTGDSLSAGQARRLACGAGLLPVVLGGASQVLDSGRTQRLFTEAQRVVLATRHTSCAADGCDRPFAWCELHHRRPWARGGNTDLADAVPLCWFHHRRVHDPGYEHRYRPGGAVTFHRRT